MPKVRTLRRHGNGFGQQWAKAVNEEYEHPRPKADLATGNVELAAEAPPAKAADKIAAPKETIDAADGEARGNAGNRGGAGKS